MKSKDSTKFIAIAIPLALILLIVLLVNLLNACWFNLDYRILDVYYRQAVKEKSIPPISNRIIQIFVTDETYNKLSTNNIPRSFYANLNNTLKKYSPAAVIYDIIFSQRENIKDDSLFKESLSGLPVYLPIGFRLSRDVSKTGKKTDFDLKDLKLKYLNKPDVTGMGLPYEAIEHIFPNSEFLNEAYNSGHISVIKDNDGIFRHQPLIIKVLDNYFPTITLSAFLDYVNVPFEKVKIILGDELVIPSDRFSFINNDIKIPIDKTGSVYIPYNSLWEKHTMRSVEAKKLIELSERNEYLDDLLNLIEGNFVFISDISTGTTDLGDTPLESSVPLIVLHTSLLNAFLEGKFFDSWDKRSISILIIITGVLVVFAFVSKKDFLIYSAPLVILFFLLTLSYFEFIHYKLFPVFTVASSVLAISLTTAIIHHMIINKEKRFITNAFSKYVSPQIVNKLIDDKSLLKLYGEEKEISVLFSDLQNFTSLTEKIDPPLLVQILNEYFSSMSTIVLDNYGIIDKFIGDAILCEFGVPIANEKHADLAVKTGLQMLRKLELLNKRWEKNGLPKLYCRIGINSGKAIVGNMGSEKVFNYTAIGDVVNVAARMEKANKDFGTKLLITEQTYKMLSKDKFKVRLVDEISLRGKSNKILAYEVYAFKNEDVSNLSIAYFEHYKKGINYYLKGRFDEAEQFINRALKEKPGDKSCGVILRKIYLEKNKITENG